MTARHIFASAILLLAAFEPASANSGNPCAGADAGQCTAHSPAPNLPITSPSVDGRSAYVTQIGDAHRATVEQSAPDALADIRQHGSNDTATVRQHGSGSDFALIRQTGDRNTSDVTQDGVGANVLYLGQYGSNNAITASQTATGAAGNGAILAQLGSNNTMTLAQNGDDNLAKLIQNGDGEATIKRYRDNPARFEPDSFNPDHKAIHVGEHQIVVIGRIVAWGNDEGL